MAFAARALVGLGLLLGFAACGERAFEGAAEVSSDQAVADCDLTMILAGDAIIAAPWSEVREPAFLKLVAEIRAADVAIVNLETTIHTFKGYAQANAGGSYLSAAPEIAGELAWAGIDMVAHANNHTFDYGSIAVLENLGHVADAGLVLAGSGKDLRDARAPAYFDAPNGKVALVSMASSFTPYGRASRSRPDMHGRPGLNPLAVKWRKEFVVTESLARALQTLGGALGYGAKWSSGERFRLAGYPFRVGERNGLDRGHKIDRHDLEGNLEAIREAAARADTVVVSIHAHNQGNWLRDFARQAIDAGADVFHAHGPHKILEIEFYKGKPVFYSLGDFVYQAKQVARMPSEFYDKFGLGDEASLNELRAVWTANPLSPKTVTRQAYEGLAARLCFKGASVEEVRLLPLDLHFDQRPPDRGRPDFASAALGRKIIDRVARQSGAGGTRIGYDPEDNVGLIRSPRDARANAAADDFGG